ncbi:para-aminobenzoate synthase [Scheffersomyces coipomensis]|uniref:para-aminobenzoate synthase n=1 Tax=Scheffersomyces coipomensis TaxID=1788519 RepID=UPI00315CABA9
MILLIDSYDSFTNNLAHLLKENVNREVITIHNDSFAEHEYEQFYNEYLPYFDFLVIGPGPGSPSNEKDVGIIKFLFQKFKQSTSPVIPVLGICLGFQCMCYSFGNQINKLENVKHGQVYDIYPIETGSDLFTGNVLKQFGSVRYHSLFVDGINDEIEPLAYCFENNDSSDEKSKVLMAGKHKSLPFYGVQYHPESICSHEGANLVKTFSNIANEYNQSSKREIVAHHVDKLPSAFKSHTVHEGYLIPDGSIKAGTRGSHDIYLKKFVLDDDIFPTDLCNFFHNEEKSFLLLNSASLPGEWSIIGLPITGKSEIITHSVDNSTVTVESDGFKSTQVLDNSTELWKSIGIKMKDKYISREEIKSQLGAYHSRDLPFVGGYMGLISYEEGQHIVLDKMESICKESTPDLKLIFIERFIVYDHVTCEWFLVSILGEDGQWCDNLYNNIIGASKEKLKISINDIPSSIKGYVDSQDEDLVNFDFPSRETYEKQFTRCQEYLHSVLTLKKNPSPFSCFMEFDDCVIISSSPERFLSWKDNQAGNKEIELRPIKGTVRNTPDVDIELATKILKTPKEMGENLMIVDLIRHDLYQFTDVVEVSQLMAVEEYKTVYQLVSVIRGQLEKEGYHGIDVLHNSLPPGSMTGAPKKRSIELLHDIEAMQENGHPGGRRGIYSGVVGYWSVTDEADWSVIIRSVFHYTDDKENTTKTKLWRIGAGGAITVLSNSEDEWDEMELKLVSALQAFK